MIIEIKNGTPFRILRADNLGGKVIIVDRDLQRHRDPFISVFDKEDISDYNYSSFDRTSPSDIEVIDELNRIKITPMTGFEEECHNPQ